MSVRIYYIWSAFHFVYLCEAEGMRCSQRCSFSLWNIHAMSVRNHWNALGTLTFFHCVAIWMRKLKKIETFFAVSRNVIEWQNSEKIAWNSSYTMHYAKGKETMSDCIMNLTRLMHFDYVSWCSTFVTAFLAPFLSFLLEVAKILIFHQKKDAADKRCSMQLIAYSVKQNINPGGKTNTMRNSFNAIKCMHTHIQKNEQKCLKQSQTIFKNVRNWVKLLFEAKIAQKTHPCKHSHTRMNGMEWHGMRRYCSMHAANIMEFIQWFGNHPFGSYLLQFSPLLLPPLESYSNINAIWSVPLLHVLLLCEFSSTQFSWCECLPSVWACVWLSWYLIWIINARPRFL